MWGWFLSRIEGFNTPWPGVEIGDPQLGQRPGLPAPAG